MRKVLKFEKNDDYLMFRDCFELKSEGFVKLFAIGEEYELLGF